MSKNRGKSGMERKKKIVISQLRMNRYVGWFSVVTPDNNYVYRLGYQDVVNQMGSGLGETC